MKFKYKLLSILFANATKSETHAVLYHWNSYYKNLSTANQAVFLIRTLLFLKTTNFLSEPTFLLTREMKIVVSSAFTQITFGLNLLTFSKFNTIFIAPRAYSYKNRDLLFDGDVNVRTGRINLSWPAVEYGFKISNDALNLAIHEIGHCLIIENSKGYALSSILNSEKLDTWKVLAFEQMKIIHTQNDSFFRNYGGENLMEMFSVSLEAFFEKPVAFHQNAPVLYLSMCELLQQDPRNIVDPLL